MNWGTGELGKAPAARAKREAAERERLGVGPQAHWEMELGTGNWELGTGERLD